MKLRLPYLLPQIVELLIEKTDPRYLYESMLLAITLDHDEIALAILRHPIYEMMEARGEIDQVSWLNTFRPREDGRHFAYDIF